MKNIAFALIFTLFLTLTALNGFTQPPPPGGEHGQTGNQNPGGNAPIGGGLFFLLGFGAIYAGKKLYKANSKQLVD